VIVGIGAPKDGGDVAADPFPKEGVITGFWGPRSAVALCGATGRSGIDPLVAETSRALRSRLGRAGVGFDMTCGAVTPTLAAVGVELFGAVLTISA